MSAKRTPSIWTVLLIVLALVATACGDDGGGDPDDGGDGGDTGEQTGDGGDDDVLVVGVLEDMSGLDPAKIYEKFASDILFNTTNRLVEFAPGETEVGPGLATDWEISDDGLEYTFQLREDVTFHDGSEFTADDVKFSLERSLNMNHPQGAAFLIEAVEEIEVLGDHEVKITIAEPNVTFLSRLNYTVASILPSDGDTYTAPDGQLEEGEGADEYVNDATIVGTGPYELADYSPGESITLERFDDYWGEGAQIQTVRIQFFDDSAQMRNALVAGEIDVNFNEFAPAERADLEGTDGITVYEGPGARIRYAVIDVNQAPFDDPEVRRSISAAIDRQRIIDEVFEGAGEPLYSMIPSGFDWAHDPSPIEDLEVTVEGPIEFELWYPQNRYGDTEPDVAETIARSLNETGVFDVTTNSAEWASEYVQNLSSGAYGIYLLGWYPDYFDPDDYIEPFYDTNGFIGFYSSQEMDDLIRQEQEETEQDARGDIFREIQELAAEDMPFIPLYEEAPFSYYRDGLTGVEETTDAVQQTRFWVIGRS